MKTLDTRHEYRGNNGLMEGICRVQVYTLPDQPPLVVCIELIENKSTSVTNMCEYLAAEVTERYLTTEQTLGHQPPFLWVEIYERDQDDRFAGIKESRSTVLFEHYRREKTTQHCRPPGFRYRIGQPDWSYIARDAYEALVRRYGGDDADVAIGDVPGRLAWPHA